MRNPGLSISVLRKLRKNTLAATSSISDKATCAITSALLPGVRRRELSPSPVLSTATRSVRALRMAGTSPNSSALITEANRLKRSTR